MAPVVLARDERGAGPVLLLIHGFPLDRAMWAGVARLSRARRCVAVDLRAHGASPGPPAGSIDDLADDCAATLDDLGAADADVCGWSMGAYVAAALARRHRTRVRSLVLCGAKTVADSPADRTARDAAIERVRARGTAILYDELYGRMVARRRKEIEEAFRGAIDRLPVETAAADLAAMRDRPDASEGPAGLRVLWIHGARDAVVPLADARAQAGRIGARFVVVRGAGHLVPAERPRAFVRAVERFSA